jgi:hypothetical protein
MLKLGANLDPGNPIINVWIAP